MARNDVESVRVTNILKHPACSASYHCVIYISEWVEQGYGNSGYEWPSLEIFSCGGRAPYLALPTVGANQSVSRLRATKQNLQT